MKFVLISYANDSLFWEDGKIVGSYLDDMKESKPDDFNKYMKSQNNSRWYTLWKDSGDWPHPNRIMVDMLRIDPYTQIDWIPEINLLGIYVESAELMNYLKEYCGSVMYYHETD